MDAVVIGAGPNGLVAGATLARHGWKVLVLEAQNRPGGALYSEPFTLPGYVHDVGAAFFPFADDSPAFRSLDLAGAGLSWGNAPWESCHPAPDGSSVAIARDLERTVQSFGVDGPAWRRLGEWIGRMGSRLAEALLAPLPGLPQAWRLGPVNLLRLARSGLVSPASFSRWYFKTEAAARVVPGLALHVDLGPRDYTGAGLGLVLALLAARAGFRIPIGGARAITDALIHRLQEAGGSIQLGSRVNQILVRRESGWAGRFRAVAVRTEQGEEIPVRRAVLADVGAPALFLRLLPQHATNGWIRRGMKRFRYGWGTFKMDWALNGPVPWTVPEARSSAVVHAGDSIADLIRFTRQVRRGQLPDNPYLVIGQQSLVDEQRAPPGCHTLWAYSRVPPVVEGGWPAPHPTGDQRTTAVAERFADRIEERIEGLAPGFRERILARHVVTPADLEAMDENLVGGDLGGGSAQFDQQLFFRPIFPYFRYHTPVQGVYLASASAHPGAGVHGAGGYNAAMQALRRSDDKMTR